MHIHTVTNAKALSFRVYKATDVVMMITLQVGRLADITEVEMMVAH